MAGPQFADGILFVWGERVPKLVLLGEVEDDQRIVGAQERDWVRRKDYNIVVLKIGDENEGGQHLFLPSEINFALSFLPMSIFAVVGTDPVLSPSTKLRSLVNLACLSPPRPFFRIFMATRRSFQSILHM